MVVRFVLVGPLLLQLAIATAVAAPPKVSYLYPAGGQRGQSIAVQAAGEYSTWPVEAWFDRPGITASCEKDKGKLKLEVAEDAVPGVYWLRLADAEGASSLKPFIVGTLPELAETETNDAPDKPQTIEPRVVINGQLRKNGDLDGFRVELSEGQTLVASVQAHTLLGSPMDSVLQVCEIVERLPSSQAGFPVQTEAYVIAQNHDATGLDPQIVFTAPRSGPYLVRLFAFPSDPNSTIGFAGGENYVYRLTLTTGPFSDHVLPLAAYSETADVRLQGWNLRESAATLSAVRAADDPLAPPDQPLVWAWSQDVAGVFAIPNVSSDLAAPVAITGAATEPVRLEKLPANISGQLAEAGEAHTFQVSGKKGEKLRVRVEARSLGFPTDPLVIVLDETGKQLAEADDAGRDDRDPELTFEVPANGVYRVIIRDLHHRGGPRMAYRAAIGYVEPDYALSLTADAFVLEPGKPLEIPVTVIARDGFKDPVEIRVVGLPEGVAAKPVTFEPSGDPPRDENRGRRRGRRGGGAQQASGQTATLVLTADANVLKPGGTPIRVEGRTRGDAPLVRSARFSVSLPLAPPHHAAWLTVKPKP